MGWNTFIHIHNDGMDQIEKHPEELAEGILRNHYRGGTAGVGCHANLLEVLPSQHADSFQLVASYQNTPMVLSKWDQRTMETVERGYADMVQGMIDKARFHLDNLEEAIKEHKENDA